MLVLMKLNVEDQTVDTAALSTLLRLIFHCHIRDLIDLFDRNIDHMSLKVTPIGVHLLRRSLHRPIVIRKIRVLQQNIPDRIKVRIDNSHQKPQLRQLEGNLEELVCPLLALPVICLGSQQFVQTEGINILKLEHGNQRQGRIIPADPINIFLQILVEFDPKGSVLVRGTGNDRYIIKLIGLRIRPSNRTVGQILTDTIQLLVDGVVILRSQGDLKILGLEFTDNASLIDLIILLSDLTQRNGYDLILLN